MNVVVDMRESPTLFEALMCTSFMVGVVGPFGCLRGDTLVVTEHGPIPIADIDRATRVLSWDETKGQFVLALSGGAFPKGRDCLFRVSTQQGEFVAAGHHRMLCADGRYRRVRDLRRGQSVSRCSPDLAGTNDGACLKSLPSDGHHWSRTLEDLLGRYAASARRYGLRRYSAIADRIGARRQDDARAPALSLAATDDRQEPAPSHNHPDRLIAPQSMTNFGHLSALPAAASGSHVAPLSDGRIGGRCQSSGQSRRTIWSRQPVRSPADASRSFGSSICEGTIIAIERLAEQEIFWDLQVLDTNNYVTVDGTIHHNSGKSVMCATWCIKAAFEQEPAPDGIRYTRIAVIRNTAPELKSTTIKTFLDLWPEGVHGNVVMSSPITYHFTMPKSDREPGIDCEILFVGLDKPKDVKHLLSLELSKAWVNEAREIPYAVVDALTGRVGRYPSKEKGSPTLPQIICDTNPPDEDGWFYRYFEVDPPRITWKAPSGKLIDISWSIFRQPPAMLECKQLDHDSFASIEPGYSFEYEAAEMIPAAGKYWGVNPEAENLKFLEEGYYAKLTTGKALDFIQCYAQGKYVFVRDGKPVVPEFADEFMADEFPILEDRRIVGGIDIGGGTLMPAAAITQRHLMGNWLVQSEVVAQNMGVDNFADALKRHLDETYPRDLVEDAVFYTDPAAEVRDEIFETKVNEHLRARGIKVMPAPTNDWKVRRLAIAQPCSRFIGGKPGLLVHRKRCPMIRKGLAGAWYFRRMAITGVEAFTQEPLKNEYSHPCEALGYALSGGGETRLTGTKRFGMGTGEKAATLAGGQVVIGRDGWKVFS